MKKFTKTEVYEKKLTIIGDKVYDLKKFFDHPGGTDILENYEGKDATESFKAARHSKRAIEMMQEFFVGFLEK